jgi:hypothetical protein
LDKLTGGLLKTSPADSRMSPFRAESARAPWQET